MTLPPAFVAVTEKRFGMRDWAAEGVQVIVLPLRVAPEGAVTSAKTTAPKFASTSIWYVYVVPWVAVVPGVLMKAGALTAEFSAPELQAVRKTNMPRSPGRMLLHNRAQLLAGFDTDFHSVI